MPINAVTYYEVVCSYPDCGIKSGELGDYSAWSDAGYAADEWVNSDGFIDEKTGETLCSEHRPPLCVECNERATGLDADGEHVCDDCGPAKVSPDQTMLEVISVERDLTDVPITEVQP